MSKIIAIGGGEIGGAKPDGSGLFDENITSISKEILHLTGKPSPRLLFIPTASNDSDNYSTNVKKHFTKIGFSDIQSLHLIDTELTQAEIRKIVLSFDAIYVGGGNTLKMMTTWRKAGVDKVLHEARQKDIVLSGLSAGSICWFNQGSSDSRSFTSGSTQLIKVTGLGFIDAFHCPHYDTQASRRGGLKRMIKTTPGAAIALDDCAALEIVDNTYRVITSKKGAKAYKTYWKDGEYHVEEIASTKNFQDIETLLHR